MFISISYFSKLMSSTLIFISINFLCNCFHFQSQAHESSVSNLNASNFRQADFPGPPDKNSDPKKYFF